ncbi:MAG: PEP-CTERM sorting domain-containing protein [Candidatus Korobacteraceae bacterium]
MVKFRAGFLTLSFVALMAGSAIAGNLYDNGPEDRQNIGWTINFGFTVSDSMMVSGTVQGLDFWVDALPGDTISNVQMLIGSAPFGSEVFNGIVSLTQSDCAANEYGYNVCLEAGSFSGPTLNGNYWLTLSNANVPSGDPVYWNENSGIGCMSPGCPSEAQENTLGTIPSEAFTVVGTQSTTTSSTGTTPEPGSILLLGSGVMGVLVMLRRKIG